MGELPRELSVNHQTSESIIYDHLEKHLLLFCDLEFEPVTPFNSVSSKLSESTEDVRLSLSNFLVKFRDVCCR